MQESRLFKIIYYLLSKGKATAPELAEKFEVSVRTIYRDIDILSSGGIPVYATQGKGGGIAILEDFVLDKSLLTNQEKEEILMALQGMLAIQKEDAGELLTKLSVLFQSKTINWIEVDFSDWVSNRPKQDLFDRIKKAILGCNILSFRYFGSNGESLIRRVEPIKLVFKSKDWYLYGFCLQRKKDRFFKLTRIKDLEIQEEHFLRRMEETDIVHKEIKIEKTIPVTLKFDKKAAFRVYDEFAEAVTEDEKGDLYVQIQLPDNDGLYSYLFSFADCIEVIEPPLVKDGMKKN